MYTKCLVIRVEKNDSIIETLKIFGYEKRSGSAAYIRNNICIVPKKKWYWEDNGTLGTEIRQL